MTRNNLVVSADYSRLVSHDVEYRFFANGSKQTAIYSFNENKFSLGAEYNLRLSSELTTYFRTGMYQSKVDKSFAVELFPSKSSGITFGVGALILERFTVDLALDRRAISPAKSLSDQEEETENLMSFAVAAFF
jgi:hypothetical protein